jgi:hypothetical protein
VLQLSEKPVSEGYALGWLGCGEGPPDCVRDVAREDVGTFVVVDVSENWLQTCCSV